MTEIAISETNTLGNTPTVGESDMAISLKKLNTFKVVGSTIYFRIKVPSNVRHWFSCPEVSRSIGLTTKTIEEVKEAKDRLDDLRTFAKKVFFMLTLPELSHEAKVSLVNQLCPKKAKVPAEAPAKTKKEKDRGKLLSETRDEYVRMNEMNNCGIKTMHEIRYCTALVIEIAGGDKPIAEYTRDDAKKHKNTLFRLPPNHSKFKAFRDKSIAELLELQDNYEEQRKLAIQRGQKPPKKIPTLSRTTVNNKLTWASAMFNFAIQERFYPDGNPFGNLKLKRTVQANQEKSKYSADEMQRIFDRLQWDFTHPERFWVTMIGIYHGVRMNQICQLYQQDIIEDPLTGLVCFKFHMGSEDQHLKTSASVKTVPIHPYLLEIGLMDYIRWTKRNQDSRLFMRLYLGAGLYSHGMSKWYSSKFNPYILDDKSKSNASFHSFRHGLINLLKQKLVSGPLISGLVGHENESAITPTDDKSITMMRYSQQYEPQVLAPIIALVDYQQIYDMSNIERQAELARVDVGAMRPEDMRPVIVVPTATPSTTEI